MSGLISVIVPIYKTERSLSKCLDSIVAQTYTNLEIILIDDGSPDACPAICDSYAKNDVRVKVIHQKNGGVSKARNVGVRTASGDYIGFVDSDDFIKPQMFEVLIALIEQTSSDIAICQYQSVYEGEPINEFNEKVIVNQFNNIETLNNLFNKFNASIVIPCNKLYKRFLFEGISYPEGKIHEDEYITYKLIYRAKKIVWTNEELYYYLRKYESITRKAFSVDNLAALEALDERKEFFKNRGHAEFYHNSIYQYLYKIIHFYFKTEEHQMIDNNIELRRRFKHEYNKLKNVLSLKNRVKFLAFYVSPSLYRMILTRLGRELW